MMTRRACSVNRSNTGVAHSARVEPGLSMHRAARRLSRLPLGRRIVAPDEENNNGREFPRLLGFGVRAHRAISDTAASPSGLPLSPADRTDGGGSRRLPVAIRLPLRLLAFRALDVYAREAAPNPTLAMLDRLLADRAQWAGTVRRHVRRATSRDHEWPLGKILKAATSERGDEPRTVVRPTRPLKCRGAGQPCLGRLIDCPFVTRVRAIQPMRPTLMREPFHREGWVYEEKYDSFRMLSYMEAQRVRLISRNGRD